MQEWKIESSPAVDNFMADNSGLVDDLVSSIESLMLAEGFPDIGATEVEPNLLYWLTENYIVVYRRLLDEKIIRLISIKPDDF
ncbi:hypothetical protein KFU94_33780 [Chloroflexi bacterium TSY]|nr:hypothetical protein [Chloroflexi bacterium TSY]